MRHALDRYAPATAAALRRPILAAAAVGGAIASLAMAAPALAKPVVDENFKPFADCPIAVKHLESCVVATTTSGEFKLGGKTVHIEEPVVLQGGLLPGDRELIPPPDGKILLAPAMKVPGGLTGIEGVGEEVTATTELVGPVLINEANQLAGQGTAVTLPLRVKLNNSVLGEECFVGTPAEPVTLNLTTGTTSPPAPNTPITGSPGSPNFADEIITFSGASLVDNSFSASGVNGCGGALSAVLDPVVDVAAGLPSAAGNNTAILNGSVMQTSPKAVKKSHVIKKPKKAKA